MSSLQPYLSSIQPEKYLASDLLRSLQIVSSPKNPLLVGALGESGSILIGDIDHHRLAGNFSEVTGQRILIVTCTVKSLKTKTVLNNVMQALMAQDTPLKRLDSKRAKRLYQQHLGLERGFFEEAMDHTEATDYQAYFLCHHNLYPLHLEGTAYCYVYRQKRLLSFHLNPHQFVPLAPDDLLILTPDMQMKRLMVSHRISFLDQLFRKKPFRKPPLFSPAVQQFANLLDSPLIAVRLEGVPALTSNEKTMPTNKLYELTNPHWVIGLFLLFWCVGVILHNVL